MTKISQRIVEKLANMKDNEEVSESKADSIRKSMPGYVGADFAKKADDDDILKMADLKDKKAKIYNSQLKPIYDEMDVLRKKYKLGKAERN